MPSIFGAFLPSSAAICTKNSIVAVENLTITFKFKRKVSLKNKKYHGFQLTITILLKLDFLSHSRASI